MQIFDIVEKEGTEYIIIATEEPGHKFEMMPLERYIINNKFIPTEGRTLREIIDEERQKILSARIINAQKKG